MTEQHFILASGSAIRARILKAAGLSFRIVKPDVDESIIKESGLAKGEGLEEIAMRLAEAKTMAVAHADDGLVIGADQILEFEGRAYDKPKSTEEAGKRLQEMQGRAHTLINAVAVARDGAIIWRSLNRPKLFMRTLTVEEIETYLKEAGPGILSSVGAYQIENLGARLFDRIEGDYFAVLGLSLFPLLKLLREEGVMDY